MRIQRATLLASAEIGHMTKPGETFGEIGIDLAGRIGADPFWLLSLWQKTLRTELLVVPERSRSCQSVATKPGVTARAAFPAALAVPLRISSGEHFRFRLITRDRGARHDQQVAQPAVPYTLRLPLHARAPEYRACSETGVSSRAPREHIWIATAAAPERRRNERRSTRDK